MNTYLTLDPTPLPGTYSPANYHRLTDFCAPFPRAPGLDDADADTRFSEHPDLLLGDNRTPANKSNEKSTHLCHGSRNGKSKAIRHQSSCSSMRKGYGSRLPCRYQMSVHGASEALLSNVGMTRPDVAQSIQGPLCHHPARSRPENEVHNFIKDDINCGCYGRCDGICNVLSKRVGGKRRSRSFSPPRESFSHAGHWRVQSVSPLAPSNTSHTTLDGPSEAMLETMPAEILDQIMSQLAVDIPPAKYTQRNTDLISCLLTSRTMYIAAISVLYHRVTIPHSRIFSKFLSHIIQNPEQGAIVRRLDLSHFDPIGLNRTGQPGSLIQNMAPNTLLKCLESTPSVQEVLLQEHLEHDADESVLHKLFFGLPTLRSLDLCAASSAKFVDAFTSVISSVALSTISSFSICRLSLHECCTLKSASLELLLSRLPRVTHLDLFHTRVTDKALQSIPRTAKLTHLNLGRCSQLSGKVVVDFLVSHPAAAGLCYLNLFCNVQRYRLLEEAEIDRLLSELPSSLRSLNLSGAEIRSRHVLDLQRLTKHLEELSVGYAKLSMADINSLFLPRPPSKAEDVMSPEELNWVPSSLYYIDLSGVAAITQSSLFSNSCALLGPAAAPLEVIELGDRVLSALRERKATNKRLGWVVNDAGRRGWYVKESSQESPSMMRERRGWKMGASWWGMRKVPVAYGDVGGLYGHYMYKL